MSDLDPRKLPDHLEFDEWLAWVFDHPVADPAWHWDEGAPWWNESADGRRTVAHLTELFTRGVEHLARYDSTLR